MKDKTIRDDASRLAAHPVVKAVIEELRAEKEAKHHMRWLSKEDRIWTIIWKIIEGDEIPASAKVSALNLAARLSGMFKRVQEDPATATDIEAELTIRLAGFGGASQ